MSKNRIIDGIIAIEGGFVDDPSDSGGETNYGITEQVARDNGYMGDMRNLPRTLAFGIYAAKYWDKVSADDLLELSEAIAEEVVDTGINAGTNRAGKFLQRALNVLNDREKLYDDITVDGSIGPGTIAALFAYLDVRDESTLVKMLNCLQGAFYVELAERREKDERFINGWFNNRVVM